MDTTKLLTEIVFKTSRSSGAGGQHVNKVESKVTLIWNIDSSTALSEIEKYKVKEKLSHRISKQNMLSMDNSESRSQFQNKDKVIDNFLNLLTDALHETKERKPTKTPKSVILERLDRKKKTSQKKKTRNIRNYLD